MYFSSVDVAYVLFLCFTDTKDLIELWHVIKGNLPPINAMLSDLCKSHAVLCGNSVDKNILISLNISL